MPVIMVNYIPRFNFVYKLQCLKRTIGFDIKFLKISLFILIWKSLKQGLLPFIARLLPLNKHIVRSLRATRAGGEHFKLCAHLLSSYEYVVNKRLS